MFEVEKYVVHWREGAQEALDTADDLINKDHRVLFGLFFVHLALEKIVKALFIHRKKALPPRFHNLIRLAEQAELVLDDQTKKTLAEVNEFNIEGRYSDLLMPPPTLEEARNYLRRAKGAFEWLTRLF